MKKRGVVLCADDYGLSPGVGRAIRDLIAVGRLSATSCMTTTPHWPREAALLRDTGVLADIGLHLTLTDQPPLGRLPGIAPEGRLPSLNRLIRLAYAGRVDRAEIAAECERQLDAFELRYGRPPAFIDGHHHVHQLPVVGDVVIGLYERRLRNHGAYLRYTDEPLAAVWRRGLAVGRATVISVIARDFARRARSAHIPGNRSFRGVRSFTPGERFSEAFKRFIAAPEEPTIVMCHPAIPDDALAAADRVAGARGEEYSFLASEDCTRLLDSLKVRIARFGS